MMIFWHLLSALGNSIITMPIALAIAIWLYVSKERLMALNWCLLLGVSLVLVVATKIAFIGWGIGIESLDFIGISGHATRGAAVYPVLFYYGLQRAPRKLNTFPVYCGVVLGILIAISRVMVHAHSISEIVSGWVLGSVVAVTFFAMMKSHIVLTSRRWLVLCSFSFILISPVARPFRADGVLTHLALYISGHQEPYIRGTWRHSDDEMDSW
ncbi:membrane-associated phospholipid phosphatase [Oxalobacteraceae bacterium GrIS 2.11]